MVQFPVILAAVGFTVFVFMEYQSQVIRYYQFSFRVALQRSIANQSRVMTLKNADDDVMIQKHSPHYWLCMRGTTPDSKVHGANMGPSWGRQDLGGPHVGPMNFAIMDTNSVIRCCAIRSCQHCFVLKVTLSEF